ncbi:MULTISPECIES: cytochrome P450 [Streptomyces]|uniref:Cytochrome P450 n=1 Tax=Streptomyces doudnae TaxID=3075536 RepID=A0ABD5EX99_9ACTN|nr:MULTISPECIES: cytochrome P450 [unclassified Streptomyces]MDT0439251.1 cytochrome P450 [Streptomyces sp. DSM 41981]MYQ65846.1 cytochrome P450 [Streptomyces sp. SID4950]SCE08895.1 pentalenic acid synthase [Streptomyces sp. SolWspMP-5a-2]
MTDSTAIAGAESPAVPSFPIPRKCPHQLPDGYARMRAEGLPMQRVTLFDGGEAWVVTQHSLARRLLSDPRLSSERTRPGFPAISPAERAPRPFRSLTEMDGTDHDVHRRMLIPAFTVRRIQELRPQVQETVDGRLDAMIEKGPSADLVSQFAVHVPSMVICRLLDVSYDDHEFFQALTQRITQDRGTLSADEFRQAIGQIHGYLDRLVTEQEREPGPGLLGLLASERVAGGTLEHGELVSMALVLLVAAQETTSSTLTSSVLTLLENPAELARLQADPEMWTGALEELLRFTSVADLGTRRVAADDIEIDGLVIRSGEGVIIPNSLVNRDPAAFEDPDVLDVGRSARNHLAFGHGVHNCIGQNMSRLILEVSLRTLFERLPGLRLAVPVEELEMSAAGGVQTLTSLPVTW